MTNMKTYYKVESTEKIINDGQPAAGDVIKSKEIDKYSDAFKTANKWLKEKNVYSVWIYKFEEDEYGNEDDPTWFMYKYTDSKDWKKVSSN